MGRKRNGILIMAVLTVCSGMPLQGAEDTNSSWKVSVAPYVWFSGIDGTVTVRGRDADVHATFGDILDNLDVAGMMQVEASKDGSGFFIQPNYLKLSADATYTVPSTGGHVKADSECETLFVEFGGFYRIVEEPGGDKYRPGSIDIIGGLRYWDVSNEVKVNAPAAGVSFKVKKDMAILDPFIGFRMRTYLADKVLFNGRIDVGGLNTGSSSNFTYNLVALVGYDISASATLLGGYRVLSLEFGDSTNGFDVMMYGPVVGVQITF